MGDIAGRIRQVYTKHLQSEEQRKRKRFEDSLLHGAKRGRYGMKETLHWQTDDPFSTSSTPRKDIKPLVDAPPYRPRFRTTVPNHPENSSPYEWSWADKQKPKRRLPNGFALWDGSNEVAKSLQPSMQHQLHFQPVSNSPQPLRPWEEVDKVMGRRRKQDESMCAAVHAVNHMKEQKKNEEDRLKNAAEYHKQRYNNLLASNAFYPQLRTNTPKYLIEPLVAQGQSSSKADTSEKPTLWRAHTKDWKTRISRRTHETIWNDYQKEKGTPRHREVAQMHGRNFLMKNNNPFALDVAHYHHTL